MPIPVLGPIVIGAVGTGATAFIKTFFENTQARKTHKEAELQRAGAILEEVSVAMDTLAFLSKEAMYILVFRRPKNPNDPSIWIAEDKKVWDEYLTVLKNWKASKNKNLAEVTTHFGEAGCKLLADIQEDLHDLERKIMATFYDRRNSKYFLVDKDGDDNDFRTKFSPVWNKLETNIVKLVQEMISMIQQEDVGTIKTRGRA